ncbi:MAG: DNA polymerase III subunit delta' [Pseudomonadota bacterium]
MSGSPKQDLRRHPGLARAVAHVEQALSQSRLAQALLLGGGQGLGKGVFARALVAHLLCEQTSADTLDACGQCRSCHLLAVDSHPDFLHLVPEGEGKQIPVQAVREASAFLQLTPQIANRRVLLAEPAEAMHHYAANAFLKTLEEPGMHAQILLLSHEPNRLLPTIRSRCQQLAFVPAETAVLEHWLQETAGVPPADAAALARFCFGRPQKALTWWRQGTLEQRRAWLQRFLALPGEEAAASLKTAAEWAKQGEAAELLPVLHTVFADLLRLRLLRDAPIINSDCRAALEALARRVQVPALLELEGAWRQAYLAEAQNLNLTLVLEDLLLRWQDRRLWARPG